MTMKKIWASRKEFTEADKKKVLEERQKELMKRGLKLNEQGYIEKMTQEEIDMLKKSLLNLES